MCSVRDKDVELASLHETFEDAKECSFSMHSMSHDLTLLITDLQHNADTTRSQMKSLIEQRDDLQARLDDSNESVHMLLRRQADSEKKLKEDKEEVAMCHSTPIPFGLLYTHMFVHL
jgi:chromosome segregation ATPase